MITGTSNGEASSTAITVVPSPTYEKHPPYRNSLHLAGSSIASSGLTSRKKAIRVGDITAGSFYTRKRGLIQSDDIEQGPIHKNARKRTHPVNQLYRIQIPKRGQVTYPEVLKHRLHYARIEAANGPPPEPHIVPNAENWHTETRGPNSLSTLFGVQVKHAIDPEHKKQSPKKTGSKVRKRHWEASTYKQPSVTEQRQFDRSLTLISSHVSKRKVQISELEAREHSKRNQARRYRLRDGWSSENYRPKKLDKLEQKSTVTEETWNEIDEKASVHKTRSPEESIELYWKERKLGNNKDNFDQDEMHNLDFSEHRLEIEVLKLIVEREYCLKALRKGGRLAYKALTDPRIRHRMRQISLAIVENIVQLRWYRKEGLEQRKQILDEDPADWPVVPFLGYMWNNQNYLLKMITDLNFVPLGSEGLLDSSQGLRAGQDCARVSGGQAPSGPGANRVGPTDQLPKDLSAPRLSEMHRIEWGHIRNNPFLMECENLVTLDDKIFNKLKLSRPASQVWKLTQNKPSEAHLRLLRCSAHLLLEARHVHGESLWQSPSNGGLRRPSVPPSFQGEPFGGDIPSHMASVAPELLVQCILDARSKHNTTRGCWVAVQALGGRSKSRPMAPINPFVGAKANQAFWKSVAQEEERAFASSKQFHLERFAAFVVTRFVRRYSAWNVERKEYAATKVASWARMVLTKQARPWFQNNAQVFRGSKKIQDWLTLAHSSAVRCQTFYHRAMAISKVWHLRREHAAVVLQQRVRFFLTRHRRKREQSTLIIQCSVRRYQARQKCKGIRTEIFQRATATRIQVVARVWLAKRIVQAKKRHNAAVVIQREVRRQKLIRLKKFRAKLVIVQSFARQCIAKNVTNRQRVYFIQIRRIQHWFKSIQSYEAWLLSERTYRALPADSLNFFVQVKTLRAEFNVFDEFKSTRRAINSIRTQLKYITDERSPVAVLQRAALHKLLVGYQRKAKEFVKHKSKGGTLNQKKLMDIRSAMWAKLEPLEAQTKHLEQTVKSRVVLERQFEKVGIFGLKNPQASTLETRMKNIYPQQEQLKQLRIEEQLLKSILIPAGDVVQAEYDENTAAGLEESNKRGRADYIASLREKLFGDQLIDRVIDHCKKRKQRLLCGTRLEEEREGMKKCDLHSQHLRAYLAASTSQLNELKCLFEKYDQDMSGRIELGELQLLSFTLGLELSKTVLVETLKVLSATQQDEAVVSADGITFDKFCVWWLCEAQSEQVKESMDKMSNFAHAQLHTGLVVKLKTRQVVHQLKSAKHNAFGGLSAMRKKLKHMRLSEEELEKEAKRELAKLEQSKYLKEREKQLEVERQIRQVEIAKEEAARLRKLAVHEKNQRNKEKEQIQEALEKATLGLTEEELAKKEVARRRNELEAEEKKEKEAEAERRRSRNGKKSGLGRWSLRERKRRDSGEKISALFKMQKQNVKKK